MTYRAMWPGKVTELSLSDGAYVPKNHDCQARVDRRAWKIADRRDKRSNQRSLQWPGTGIHF